MDLVELTGAGVVLLVMLGVGTVAHEATHMAVLRVLGVPYDVEWLPLRDTKAGQGLDIHRKWAAVTPQSLPRDLPLWRLRLAGLAPLTLAIPGVLILVGVLPDPLASGNVYLITATFVWLGCALPSPQDFSLFFHAGQAVEGFCGTASIDEPGE